MVKNQQQISSTEGFIIRVCNLAEAVFCPMCGHLDVLTNFRESRIHEDIIRKMYDYEIHHRYCEECCCVFLQDGCYTGHGDNENAHIIGKYLYEEKEYIGMPYYKSVVEWLHLSPKVKVLKWICPNKAEGCYLNESTNSNL